MNSFETSELNSILSPFDIHQIEEYRLSKKTAVLAILFTDICNSTQATEALGEIQYLKLKNIHDELFRKVISSDKSGRIIKEIGDSFLCVFAEPLAAVLKAIEFQRAIYSHKENLSVGNYTLQVKIGIHMGQVTVENQLSLDIFGTHVNRASRIQSIADGGQIITSQSIWENTIGWLKNQENLGIGCLPLGKTKLKGISDPVELYSFYPKEISGKNKPRLFQTKNRKRIFFSSLLILSALILCTWSYFSIICKEAEDANSKPPLKKNYFVQFDFRNIKNQTGLDSNKIREKVLSQIVSIFYPDSVIFESDLIQQFAKKGTFYVRKNNELGDLSSTYYRDSLDMDGTLLLEFYPVDYNIQNTSLFENEKYKLNNLDIDSIEINARLDFFFPDDSTFSSKSRASIFKESISNIRNDFRNDLSYMLSLMKSDLVQGTVTNLSDSFFYFHRSNESYLKVGTQVTLTRKYSGREGLTDWLNYLMQKSEFFKGKKEYQEDFKTATKEYNCNPS